MAVGQCTGDDDPVGYSIAMGEFAEHVKRLDAEDAIAKTEKRAAVKTEADMLAKQAEEMDQERQIAKGKPISDTLHYSAFAANYDQLKPTLTTGTRNVEKLHLIDRIAEYVEGFEKRAKEGRCTVAWYNEKRDKLDDFHKFTYYAGVDYPEQITENLLNDYRESQATQAAKGEFSPFTVKKRLKAVKAFFEWCFKFHYIKEMPRNLDKDYPNVVVMPAPKPYPLTLDQVHQFWNLAMNKGKYDNTRGYRNALYLLLGLNCGYRSKDIATLRFNHLRQEGEGWIIDRLRNKTKNKKVRQVHKIWKITHRLLMMECETREADDDLMLLTEHGTELVTATLSNKTSHTDAVGANWGRMKRKLKLGKGYGHSCCRDTGSSDFARLMPESPIAESQYLSHKFPGMSETYIQRAYERLFTGIDKLEEYYGLNM